MLPLPPARLRLMPVREGLASAVRMDMRTAEYLRTAKGDGMKKRMAGTLGALGLLLPGLLLAGQAQAHHAFSMFDAQKELTLEGTVKEFQWTNPHSWVQVMVRDATGKEVEWSIEGASPNNLARYGWKSSSIKAGDHVLAIVHPLKDGSIGGSLVKITVNGQVIGSQKPS